MKMYFSDQDAELNRDKVIGGCLHNRSTIPVTVTTSLYMLSTGASPALVHTVIIIVRVRVRVRVIIIVRVITVILVKRGSARYLCVV